MDLRPKLSTLLFLLFSFYHPLSCSSRVLHAQESYAPEPPQIRSLLPAKVPVPMTPGPSQTNGVYSRPTLADLPSFAISLSSRRNLTYKNPAVREDSSSGFDGPYREFPYPPFHGKKDP